MICYLVNFYEQELTNQARLLQAQLAEVHKRLRCNLWAYDCYWVLLVIWVIAIACNGSAMKLTALCYVIRAHIFLCCTFWASHSKVTAMKMLNNFLVRFLLIWSCSSNSQASRQCDFIFFPPSPLSLHFDIFYCDTS